MASEIFNCEVNQILDMFFTHPKPEKPEEEEDDEKEKNGEDDEAEEEVLSHV